MSEKCVFCKDLIVGFGHNPAPVANTGRCCDLCNDTVVIPYRLAMLAIERPGHSKR